MCLTKIEKNSLRKILTNKINNNERFLIILDLESVIEKLLNYKN